jgi:hypothetical protein
MSTMRKLLPMLASGLLTGLTLLLAAQLPQPSADELQAVAELNTVPVQRRRDHQAFARYWLFGLATASRSAQTADVD